MKNNYSCHAPYLRNHTLSDHNFWYTYLKWWYDDISKCFFIFKKFWFFRLLGRIKGQKWHKMKNNYIRHAPYLRNCTLSDHDFWCIYVKWWYLPVLYFLKMLIFQAVRGAKGQKMAQNEKYLHPWHTISEEPYIIWS